MRKTTEAERAEKQAENIAAVWAKFDRILGDRDPRTIRNEDFRRESAGSKYYTDPYLAARRKAFDGRAVPLLRVSDRLREGQTREEYMIEALAGRDARDVTPGVLAGETGLPAHAFAKWIERRRRELIASDPQGLLRAKKAKLSKRWNDGCELRWWPKPANVRRVRCVVSGSGFQFVEVAK